MTDIGNIKINHCKFNGNSVLEQKSERYIPISIHLQNSLVKEFKKRHYEYNKYGIYHNVIEFTN